MKLLLWGAGAHGRVIHDLACACGYSDLAFVDDYPSPAYVCNRPVFTSNDRRLNDFDRFIVSIGDNHVRARCFLSFRERGLEPVILVHPSASVSASAKVGSGTMILPLVVLGAGAEVGENCILNTSCVVEHDARIQDHVHVSPGAVVGGEVNMGSFSQAGMGSCILSRMSVGQGALVGAGAVAITNVAPGWIVTGVPARPRRENRQLQEQAQV